MRSSGCLRFKRAAAGTVMGGIQADPMQQELKGHRSYRFNEALILHDNSFFKHLLNSTFIHSPVIIPHTTGAIAPFLCVYISLYVNCIPFTVCLPGDSHRQLQRALNSCSSSDSASQSPAGIRDWEKLNTSAAV